jgi:asparagine synthase (glutamine-hydrolysing)
VPGISAIIALGETTAPWMGAVERGLDGLLHDPRYTKRQLASSDFCHVAVTAYPGYPIATLRVGDSLVVLDGHLYGCDAARRRRMLEELAEIAGLADDEARLRRWIEATDGEYVALIVDERRGEVVIVNDLLGGLPLYYAQRPGVFVVSRELRYVAAVLGSVRFDRVAMAQHLLVGYPLGTATLLADVHRLAPASCVRLVRGEPHARHRRLRELDFEREENGRRNLAENAAMLAELFGSACAARAAHASPAVVSLSGGFDSRAIAACLHGRGIPFRSATFTDHAGNTDADAGIGATIRPLFESEWDLVRLGPPSLVDACRLLRLKTGMNTLGMSFLLPFLERIRDRHGAGAMLFTGESGTFTLPALSPQAPLRHVRDLAEFIVETYERMPLDVVESLTGVPRMQILGDLEDRLAAYPERTLGRKYVHFMVYERRIKWETEGQDRNRCYVWNTDPFHGLEFFTFAMACPDEQKRLYGLYREFLSRLSPAAAAVAHAGIGSPITSSRFRADAKAMELLRGRPGLRQRLRGLYGPERAYDPEAAVPRLLARQLQSCEAVSEYFSTAVLERLIDDCASYSTEQIDLVFTLTSVIEELGTGRSSLAAPDESDEQ